VTVGGVVRGGRVHVINTNGERDMNATTTNDERDMNAINTTTAPAVTVSRGM